MIRLVIDTDPGVDDAHAIMAAFAHPDAQVEAITTVAGNVPLERTTANACTILDILEQDVPVYAGCHRPMVGDPVEASYFHGADGLGDSGYPPSSRPVADKHAVNALVRMANESPPCRRNTSAWSLWGGRFVVRETSPPRPSLTPTLTPRLSPWCSMPGRA